MPSTRLETAPQRLAKKVIPEPNSGCWLWVGGLSGNRYGSMHDGERFVGAHHYSYRLHHGPIPKGMNVCHRCDTPTCVNPDHLYADTQVGNLQGSVKRGRAGSTVFEWNHPPGLKEKRSGTLLDFGRS